MPPRLFIEPLSGYTPTIGRLVGMLDYARATTLRAVDGLTTADLDHLHDAASNSIGALLAHMATVERVYQVLTFEERPPSEPENAEWAAALSLGDEGRRVLRGQPLEHYIEQLATTRAATLQALASRDDKWLERPMVAVPAMNAHWAWFHVAEDEVNHRGQIRWLRARLHGVPGSATDGSA